jgi:hypothetical protein
MRLTVALCALMLALSSAVVACGSDDDRTDTQAAPAATTAEAVEFREGESTYLAPVADTAEAARLCRAARKAWPGVYAKYDQVFFDLDDGMDLTCVRDTSESQEPSETGDFPEGKPTYIVPVADAAEAARVCRAAREGWPEVYAAYDEVFFDLDDGLDLTCVRE